MQCNDVFEQHVDLVKISLHSFENVTRLFEHEFLIWKGKKKKKKITTGKYNEKGCQKHMVK